MNYRYSLHKIYQKENCPFDELAYSRFKFGDSAVAEAFGKELFDGFIVEYGEMILHQEEIILLPSPYYSIPTASNYLCKAFKRELNQFLYENGKKACVNAKIHRNQTYTQDYGNMDYQQRIDLISGDTYYIDKNFIENKFCILLDDIKITGSHEVTVNRILQNYNVSGTFLFLYYAELMNTEIHPNIENHYNYFALNSIDNLIEIVNSQHFVFNTRIVKYILSLKYSDFQLVNDSLSNDKKIELFDWAISNNYHQIGDYQYNLKQIKNNITNYGN